MPNKLLGCLRHPDQPGRAVSGPHAPAMQHNRVRHRETMSFQPKEIVKRPRQRMDQAELDRVVLSHERFQAGRPGGQRAGLSYMDLSRVSLIGKNLSNPTLPASFLTDPNLPDADPRHPNLFA